MKKGTVSFAIPGRELSIVEFRKWIADAELLPTTSLEDAKSIWAAKRKQLQKKAGF